MAAALRVFFLLLLLGVSACGGGGGGAPPAEEIPSGGWVTITSPDPSYTTTCNSVTVSGEAFISPDWWECCVGSAEQMAGVTVTANGIKANQRVDICSILFKPYVCRHTWSAEIDLRLGENPITVTATDPDGRKGVASITVIHPQSSYSTAGTITYLLYPDATLSGVRLSLTGPNVSRIATTDERGTYRVTCLDDGSYSITPSKKGYAFTPESRSIVISSADALGQDFAAEAVGPWTVSGSVIRSALSCSTCSLVLQGYALSSGEFVSLTTSTDQSGQYSFSVPNGTYEITPKFPASPSSKTVTVYNADVVYQNFEAI